MKVISPLLKPNWSQRPSIHGVGFDTVSQICGKLDAKTLLPGSSALLAEVNAPNYWRRLDHLWPNEKPAWQAANQEKFLRCVVAAVQTQSHVSNELLRKVSI